MNLSLIIIYNTHHHHVRKVFSGLQNLFIPTRYTTDMWNWSQNVGKLTKFNGQQKTHINKSLRERPWQSAGNLVDSQFLLTIQLADITLGIDIKTVVTRCRWDARFDAGFLETLSSGYQRTHWAFSSFLNISGFLDTDTETLHVTEICNKNPWLVFQYFSTSYMSISCMGDMNKFCNPGKTFKIPCIWGLFIISHRKNISTWWLFWEDINLSLSLCLTLEHWRKERGKGSR